MHFLMLCRHRDDVATLRDANRSAHRAHVASGGNGLVRVLIGSGLQADNGERSGNFGILEAETLADALAFAEGDPFNAAGVIASIEMIAIVDGFPAHLIVASR